MVKHKKVAIHGNAGFVIWCIFMGFVWTILMCFSLIDQKSSLIEWTSVAENIIGVSSQVITAIISLVVSIIGIAISLQNEDYFGVKITRLYSLRVKYHYSILAIVIVSISLCMVNLFFYMARLYIAAIGTVIIAVLFLMQVLIAEIPIMTKDKNAMISIVKESFINCYLRKTDVPTDLKDAIKYLLYRSNLRNLYCELKDKEDDEYNKYLLLEILDIQQYLAKDIKDLYGFQEQRVIADSLLGNVLDVIFRKIEASDDIYMEIAESRFLLTRVLFFVHELESMRIIWMSKIRGLTQYLEFASKESRQIDCFLSEILIVLVADTVRNGDFSILSAIRHQLSASEYCLEKESPILNLFAVLSMYLYYLKCCEPDIPDDIKNKIQDFIDESGMIEEQTKISSWKQLFARAAEQFNVNYDMMIYLSNKTIHAMEYYLFGNGAKCLILDGLFFSKWYLTHLFNSQRLPEVDGAELCKIYPNIRLHLKEFGKKCIDEDGNFVPTVEMSRIVEMYSNKDEHFVIFRMGEKRTRNFFIFLNSLRLEDLSIDVEQASLFDHNGFAEKIKKCIIEAIKEEWGYDPSMAIENDSRYFSLILEKFPDAINFEETIIEYSVDSVFSDLKKSLNRTELYKDDNFEDELYNVLLQKPKYTTSNTKTIIPYFFIRDLELKNMFLAINKSIIEIKSQILGNMFLLIDDSFRFNLEIAKVEISELSEEQVAEQLAKYQRADGRFVYEGVFLPRETIIEFIRKRFMSLTVIIRHQMESSKDKIYKLKPYTNRPEM